MTLGRRRLDTYLESVNEHVQTLRLSSEQWFHSPARHVIRDNDRFVRALMAEGLAWCTAAPQDSAHVDPDAYEGLAEQVPDAAVHFGAAGHTTLAEYFTVDPRRSGATALAAARATVTEGSPAHQLLARIDQISDADPATSCRAALRAFSHDWHMTNRKVLTIAEARELTALYTLGKYCFTEQEFHLATELVALPRLRSALLAVQLHLTAGSEAPLSRQVADYGNPRVLLPYTEAFLSRHGYRAPVPLTLCPNPKLITVLCNNVVPAIAGVLLDTGRGSADLDANAIRQGVAAARRRGVFEMMIALYDRLPDDLVALTGLNMRVCPVSASFSAFLETWLPHHFDRLR